jgi:tRNA(Arg) A34 adenosine deaminase TadA
MYAAKAGMPDKQFLHAEIHAIVKCKDLTRAHKIFVSRWDKKGLPALAKPCPVCMSAIEAAGIEIVEYT